VLNGMAAGGGGGSGASGASGFFRNQDRRERRTSSIAAVLSRAEDRARPPAGSSVGLLGPLQSHLAIPVKCPLGALLSLAAVPQGHMGKNGLASKEESRFGRLL